MFRCLAPALAVVVATGCEKFPTPAELAQPTVLAVIADPPVIPAGATSRLSVVAADDGGVIQPSVAWTLVPTFTGVPPMGAVVANADGTATYTAPDPVPPLPPMVPSVDSVQATVAISPAVVAVKLVVIADGTAANPQITDVTLGGVSALVGGASLAVGATGDLAVATDGTPDASWSYAWYSTAGAIDEYQSNPTRIVGADAAGTDWIFVVVRDGRGGTAVRGVQVTVR